MSKKTKFNIPPGPNPLIGKAAFFIPSEVSRVAGQKPFAVMVEIIGSRTVFGRIEFLVEPMNGRGQAWARRENLEIYG